jgi:LacI family transcriptional regulator, galactose operon repressor
MGHPYRIREIAQQAGVSDATVDRVLHGRSGVRSSTVAEVHQAIEDLDRQRSQLRLTGRTFMVDLVMQSPTRFSNAVRAALEHELPTLRPAVIRSRFHLAEESDPGKVAVTLASIARRGSHGVLLKAPDDAVVVDAVAGLVDRGIPVVTLFTDVPLSRRVAYVGIDNRAAGATAAYLLTRWSPHGGTVLVTVSSSAFRGEDEREIGFRAAMRQMAPERAVREVTDTNGADPAMLEAVSTVLEEDSTIDAVYSVGGGNAATALAFERAGRRVSAFIAHDLDADNLALLRQQRISAVLHHDLREDMRRACRLVMQAHGALPGVPHSLPSHVQVITPFNEPRTFAGSE